MKLRATLPVLLVCCGLAVSGCETLTETFAFDAIPRATFKDKPTVFDKAKAKDFMVTDQLIYEYASDVQKFMRLRMSGKRALRKASASIQVMTAVIATALAGFGGSSAVIAGFAGVSAIVPEFQGIFQAAAGADAFRRGAELIGNAETDYVMARSGAGGPVPDKLTPDGAKLYKRVVASIVLVEKALLEQIPTLEEVRKAEGEEAEEAEGEEDRGVAAVPVVRAVPPAPAVIPAPVAPAVPAVPAVTPAPVAPAVPPAPALPE